LLLEEVMGCAASLRRVGRMESASPGISLPQQVVLETIHRQPGLTVSQLARRRGTSRQSVQVLVDRLAEAGFLEYVANPDHRRSERLQLMESGRRALSASRRSQDIWMSGLQKEVTEDQVRACLELLQSIRAKLGGGPPAPSQTAVRPGRSVRRKHVSAPAVPEEKIPEPVEEVVPEPSPPEQLPVSLL
jgi:DNA-binding MarR family transcriptional regulator